MIDNEEQAHEELSSHPFPRAGRWYRSGRSIVLVLPRPRRGRLTMETELEGEILSVGSLARPIQATRDDVVISGHGAYTFSGETIVPQGFELWVLGPPGSSISDALGGALEAGERIRTLALRSPRTQEWIPVTPTLYRAGERAPDYVLHPPRGLVLQPGVPHLIGIEGHDQRLSDLWSRIRPLARPGKTVRVFWAACSAIQGARNPMVVHE
jgi:hypothetical protein